MKKTRIYLISRNLDQTHIYRFITLPIFAKEYELRML